MKKTYGMYVSYEFNKYIEVEAESAESAEDMVKSMDIDEMLETETMFGDDYALVYAHDIQVAEVGDADIVSDEVVA